MISTEEHNEKTEYMRIIGTRILPQAYSLAGLDILLGVGREVGRRMFCRGEIYEYVDQTKENSHYGALLLGNFHS